jgi:hypothetical protein
VAGHLLRDFEPPAVLQVRRNSGRAEAVGADLVRMPAAVVCRWIIMCALLAVKNSQKRLPRSWSIWKQIGFEPKKN